ncbi:hypothetical protein E2C01_086122 [Portunus trituberculatus]|uniref:Uncharacterized protein n=1 Tax=Portunus trituberculatus TaxID=210409 RepID=A0A5B7JAP2_PORTR|nr:hypothetical protein [Portunus trituberculatus]
MRKHFPAHPNILTIQCPPGLGSQPISLPPVYIRVVPEVSLGQHHESLPSPCQSGIGKGRASNKWT